LNGSRGPLAMSKKFGSIPAYAGNVTVCMYIVEKGSGIPLFPHNDSRAAGRNGYLGTEFGLC